MKSFAAFAAVLFLSFGLSVAEEAEPQNFFPHPYIPQIETFVKIGSVSSPYINRSTGELLFRSSMSGAPQLYRLTNDGWPYQLTLLNDGIDWYSVSNNGRLAIIGASAGGSEQSQLYLLDTHEGKLKKLTDQKDVQHGSVVWMPDDRGFYFRSNEESKKDFKLYSYDLATAQSRKIFDENGSNYIYDISPDGRYLAVIRFHSNYNTDLLLLDLNTGKAELMTPHEGDIIFDEPTIMPGNKFIYLLSNGNSEGIPKRARLEVATKKLEFLDPDERWTIDGLSFSPDHSLMVWLVNKEGLSEVRIWDFNRNRLLPSPPIYGVVSSTFITDEARLYFAYTSAVKTQDIWRWDCGSGELRKMTHSIYAGIDPSLFVEPQLIKYKSFDGLEVPAFLYLPPDFEGKPIPFIIHAHGGPESQFRPYFQRNFQYLLLNGYGILAPNIRGSSGYGKDYLNLDNYKKRLNSIKDIKAAADFLIWKNYSTKGLIGIKGGSYGGYVVLAAITEYPDLFGAAVDEVGIANFRTFLTNTKDYRRHLREAEYGPMEDTAFLASISPIHKAHLIKTPLLVVHGENDPRVPVGEARQILKAVAENGGAVDSLIFPDEGHGVSKVANSLVLYRKMVDFFDRYLKKEN